MLPDHEEGQVSWQGKAGLTKWHGDMEVLVIIKSGPDSEAAMRAVGIARDETADIVLIRDAVYLARPDGLEGFCGTAFAFAEDVRARGIVDIDKGVKEITAEELIELMAGEDRVMGVF